MNAPETVAPDRIANHLIVGAADLAHFVYGSDEQRSSAAFAISAQSATRSPRAAAPCPSGLMQMMALALADACTKVSRERLNELAARTGLHTSHLTPPGQETAWIRPMQESKVNLPLIVCSIEATRP